MPFTYDGFFGGGTPRSSDPVEQLNLVLIDVDSMSAPSQPVKSISIRNMLRVETTDVQIEARLREIAGD